MAELRLDDKTARTQVTVYSEVFNQYRNLLIKDQLVIIKGESVADDYYESGLSVNARDIYTLAQIRARFSTLKLKIDKKMLANGLVNDVKQVLGKYQFGTNSVFLEYNNGFAATKIDFGEDWRIKINDELVSELGEIVGQNNVALEFPGRIAL